MGKRKSFFHSRCQFIFCQNYASSPETTCKFILVILSLSCNSGIPLLILMFFQESLVRKTTESLALRNILNQQIPVSKNGLLRRTFSHLYQVYELKKFDYPQVADLVLHDERLKRAIEKATVQQFQDSDNSNDEFFQQLHKSNEKRAKKLLFDMRSTLSDFLLRWVIIYNI